MHPLQAANRFLAVLSILQEFRIGKKVRGPAQVQKRGHPWSGGLCVFSFESIALSENKTHCEGRLFSKSDRLRAASR